MTNQPHHHSILRSAARLPAAGGVLLSGLLLSGALLATAPALALEPFNAEYRASYMGMQATGNMTLARNGQDQWEYKVEVAGMGARLTQSTTFDEHDGHWRPLKSVDSQAGESGLAAMLVKNRSVEATYDWDAKQARWSGDVDSDATGPVQLRAGDMDGMLINLAVARDAAAGQTLNYRLVEDGRVRGQQFRFDGTETISVAGEQREATRVVRTSGRRETIAWVVDDLPVPARILQRRNGRDHLDLQLQSFN